MRFAQNSAFLNASLPQEYKHLHLASEQPGRQTFGWSGRNPARRSKLGLVWFWRVKHGCRDRHFERQRRGDSKGSETRVVFYKVEQTISTTSQLPLYKPSQASPQGVFRPCAGPQLHWSAIDCAAVVKNTQFGAVNAASHGPKTQQGTPRKTNTQRDTSQ